MTDFDHLAAVARSLVAPGKGILAADESTPTIAKRFASIGIDSTEAARRDYREMLFTTSGMASHVSGVILYDETLRQNGADGTPLREMLRRQGVQPGIKVDTGAKPLPLHEGETVTEGLDGLAGRLAEYAALGATFAKWRAVYRIDEDLPSGACVEANAHALARYAAACQEAGIVPIVEPEVLMDGDHDLETCELVTTDVLAAVYDALYGQDVELEATLLKPSMIVSGSGCSEQAGIDEVAEATLRVLRRTVPAAVPGIVFLSGGQSAELATRHLDAMNRRGPHPWALSFSYGRALQAPALAAWSGQAANRAAGQAAFLKRARCNGAARDGAWVEAMEA